MTAEYQTKLRYEVWGSLTGDVRGWHRLHRQIFHGALGKQHALQSAEMFAQSYAKICVEEYDDGRDVYLRTVIEYPG